MATSITWVWDPKLKRRVRKTVNAIENKAVKAAETQEGKEKEA